MICIPRRNCFAEKTINVASDSRKEASRKCPGCGNKGPVPTRICLNNCHFKYEGTLADAAETTVDNGDGKVYGDAPFFSRNASAAVEWTYLNYIITKPE